MKKERIVVFGYGAVYQNNKTKISEKYDVLYVVDNNNKNWGNGYEDGIEVCSPRRILKDADYDIVMVTVKDYAFEIAEELSEMGISNEKIKLFLPIGFLRDEDCKMNFVSSHIPKFEIVLNWNDRKLRFDLRNTTDIVVFEELFLFRGYEFLPDFAGFSVIDIGMNTALATLYFASMSGVKKVYGYEAFPKTYEIACDNIAKNPELSEIIVPNLVGLSDHDDTLQIEYSSKRPGDMDIFHKTNENRKEQELERVVIRDAAEALEGILQDGSDEPLVMKIDCEGSEYDIIASLDKKDLIRKVKVYIIETHLGRRYELVDLLNRSGFFVFSQISCGNPNLGMIYAVRGK